MESSTQLAVIFDMDGVLVDTYHAHYQSWVALAEREGFTFTEAQFAPTFGRTSREIIGHFWGAELTEERIAEMDAAKEEAFRRIIEDDFPAMPGARKLIDSLSDDGFALAVGSSGPPENVAMVLDKLGVSGRFQAVVTGMDVTRGKPDPQVFLLAAERLGTVPVSCTVIEDAPTGVVAARAAGMQAVGLVSTGRTSEELADADLVVQELAELTPVRIRGLF